MREVVCPNCDYETVLVASGSQLCPHGCTVDDYQTNYDTPHKPPARSMEDSEDLDRLFGDQPGNQRLVLLVPDGEDMALARAERGETDD